MFPLQQWLRLLALRPGGVFADPEQLPEWLRRDLNLPGEAGIFSPRSIRPRKFPLPASL